MLKILAWKSRVDFVTPKALSVIVIPFSAVRVPLPLDVKTLLFPSLLVLESVVAVPGLLLSSLLVLDSVVAVVAVVALVAVVTTVV